MRVPLKGLNVVKKTLKNGKRVAYYYAWKGGPSLTGEIGTPEFFASYQAAIATKSRASDDMLASLLASYQNSSDFTKLAERTRKDYIRQIKRIEAKLADFPISALGDRETRGIFLEWRDDLAKVSRRQADYAYAVLALILSWAIDRGKITTNPCERAGKVYRSKRIESVWMSDDEKAFLDSAPEHLRLAFMLAIWTGQRQGDLLKLPWTGYNGSHIRLQQSKTGARVTIKVGKPLKVLLDATKRVGPNILMTTDKTAWTESGFRASWRTACKKAGVSGVTFHDLRGTAVTRLAIAGCTESEIATITGHSLRDVGAILDAHYLKRDVSLGDAAILKREEHEAEKLVPTGPPTGVE